MTMTDAAPTPLRSDRDVMQYDVVIVGAGPAGLSCAIRLKQLSISTGKDLSVCILEKGSEVGAHLMSGAVLEPRALDELFPDWKTRGAPVTRTVTSDKFLFLTKHLAIPFITPPQMRNHGNYMISLSLFGRWLAEQATNLGVEIYPGFAAAEILHDTSNRVIGVATGDLGIGRDGEKTAAFTPGVEIHARQVVLAEGCHGSLTKQVIKKYDLRNSTHPQTYGLGIKEIWEIDPAQHKPGHVTHTLGWPMDFKTYGGSWIYHLDNNQISIGYVVGLDYTNPYLSPFEEMQRFKTHPALHKLLTGGRRIAYGARALVEGGLQGLPKLAFPGGLLIGDTAGFLNVPKIKGNHTAMKSGMLAAEALHEFLTAGDAAGECLSYETTFKNSWIYQELYRVRNIRPGFQRGVWFGLLHAAFQSLGGWRLPYTLSHRADHTTLREAKDVTPIVYPKPDGVFTFDRLSSVFLSNTHHAEDQPVHLKLTNPHIPVNVNLPRWDEPAQRYCPAGVYEIVQDAAGATKFQINAQNCVHCKTCDIKDPSQNINWTVPQGGDGPNYTSM